MSGQGQASEWAQQLAQLAFLAGCVAVAAPRRKPKVSVLPSVEPVKSKPRRKNNPSPEVQEFMRLPQHVQRQVLDYAKNWLDAHFERIS